MRGESERARSAPRRRCRVSRPSARGRRLRNDGGRRRSRVWRPSARGRRHEKRAAQARREKAQAQEEVAAADAQKRKARELHIEAARKDPDAAEREVAERFDREPGDGSVR
jgi:hypothetical protein